MSAPLRLSCLGLALVVASTQAADVNMARLCKDLAKKGRDSYKELGVPPQVSPILTEKHKGRHEDQVLEQLTRNHSSDAPIDAYVKYQLIAFEPDFSKATPKQLEDIIESMPEIASYPSRPPSSLVRMVEISKKEKIPKGVLKEAAQAFNVTAKQIATLNGRAFEYRKRLIKSLPDAGGYKLYALLATHYDVQVAGQKIPVKTKRDPKTKKKVPAEPTFDIAYAEEIASKTGELTSTMKRNITGVLKKMMIAKSKVRLVVSASLDKDALRINYRGATKILGEDGVYYAKIMEKLNEG